MALFGVICVCVAVVCCSGVLHCVALPKWEWRTDGSDVCLCCSGELHYVLRCVVEVYVFVLHWCVAL